MEGGGGGGGGGGGTGHLRSGVCGLGILQIWQVVLIAIRPDSVHVHITDS